MAGLKTVDIQHDFIPAAYPAVLIHDLVIHGWSWEELSKQLFNPVAKPGIFVGHTFLGQNVFIPFEQKVPYLIKRKKRGLVATQTTSAVFGENWKSLTKLMGQRKREFVDRYL